MVRIATTVFFVTLLCACGSTKEEPSPAPVEEKKAVEALPIKPKEKKRHVISAPGPNAGAPWPNMYLSRYPDKNVYVGLSLHTEVNSKYGVMGAVLREKKWSIVECCKRCRKGDPGNLKLEFLSDGNRFSLDAIRPSAHLVNKMPDEAFQKTPAVACLKELYKAETFPFPQDVPFGEFILDIGCPDAESPE